ncbi:hypothetical protein Tco_0644726 [Tanacetum coccineum]
MLTGPKAYGQVHLRSMAGQLNVVLSFGLSVEEKRCIRTNEIDAELRLAAEDRNSKLTVFAVLVFSPGDDPIACLNKSMAFLTVVASSRFLLPNESFRTSSNPRNQATIQDDRVTMQQVQGRQGQIYSGTTYKGNATSTTGNTTSVQQESKLIQLISSQCCLPDLRISILKILTVKISPTFRQAVLMAKFKGFNYVTDIISQGYQNPFYLKKAQRIKPTLYDGVVMSNSHVAMHVIDDEETLILEEESRSKMSEKAKDLEVIAKKIS